MFVQNWPLGSAAFRSPSRIFDSAIRTNDTVCRRKGEAIVVYAAERPTDQGLSHRAHFFVMYVGRRNPRTLGLVLIASRQDWSWDGPGREASLIAPNTRGD
jgi:hypothetical protein